jgi:CHRD domain
VGTITDDGALTYRLRFSGLTGRSVAVHIHTGKRGVAGPVAVTLCAKNCVPRTGTLTVRKAVVVALRAGTAYVNVHTSKNPAGEIRGQIVTRK